MTIYHGIQCYPLHFNWTSVQLTQRTTIYESVSVMQFELHILKKGLHDSPFLRLKCNVKQIIVISKDNG